MNDSILIRIPATSQSVVIENDLVLEVSTWVDQKQETHTDV
jgi:hypothetical protein